MQIKIEMQQQLGKSQNFPQCNAQFEGGAKSLEKQQSRQRSEHANQVCVCVQRHKAEFLIEFLPKVRQIN